MIKSAWNTRSDSQSDVIFLTDKEILFSRDEAVESKNAAEVELAKNRIEMMQVGCILDSNQQGAIRTIPCKLGSIRSYITSIKCSLY